MKSLAVLALAAFAITPAYACGSTVTKADCSILKNSERLISLGKAYYVVHNGRPVEVYPETLKTLKLKNGASVDTATFYRAVETNMNVGLAKMRARNNK